VSQVTFSELQIEGDGDGGDFYITGELTTQGNLELAVFITKDRHRISFIDEDDKIAGVTTKFMRFLRDCDETIGQLRSDPTSLTLRFTSLERHLSNILAAVREVFKMDSRRLMVMFTHKGCSYGFSGELYYNGSPGFSVVPGYYALGDRWTYLGSDPSPEQYEAVGQLQGVRGVHLTPLIGMTDHAFDINIKDNQLDETLAGIIAILAQ